MEHEPTLYLLYIAWIHFTVNEADKEQKKRAFISFCVVRASLLKLFLIYFWHSTNCAAAQKVPLLWLVLLESVSVCVCVHDKNCKYHRNTENQTQNHSPKWFDCGVESDFLCFGEAWTNE